MLEDDETVESPAWWFLTLAKKLVGRHKQLDIWKMWYTGKHPLPRPPKEQSAIYEEFARQAITNFMPVPVRATTNRLSAIGVTDAEGKDDKTAWGWWQRNRMDSRQKLVYRTSLYQSVGYVMVGEHPRSKRQPLISLESPREVYVEQNAATGERIASVKIRFDAIKKRWKGTLLLIGDDNKVVKHAFTTPLNNGSGDVWPSMTAAMWSHDGEPETTDFTRIPVVPFEFAPEVDQGPVAIFDGVIPIQQRLNSGVLGRMTAERMAAWPQNWVTGHKFKMITDPISGKRVPEEMFVPGPDQLWVSDGENTKFGQLPAAAFDGHLKVHESDIRDLLVQTWTPAYYIASQLVNLAADTVMALDTMHIALVRELQTGYGESWEDVLGLCSEVTEEERDFTSAEMRWADPRALNPAVIADAGVKKKTIGYPLSIIAEDMGDSPQRIDRIKAEAAGDALLAAALLPNPNATPPATPAADTGTG